jgi:hypothetical protein
VSAAAVCSPAYALASALLGRDTDPGKLFAEADRLALAAERVGVRIARLSAEPEAVTLTATALLNRVDRHVYECAEPLFLDEREALRAALTNVSSRVTGA